MWVPPEADGGGIVESAEPLQNGRRPASSAKNWAGATDGLSGVIDDDMSGRNAQRKLGTTQGSPRRSRTAKAPRITGSAGKSRRAPEWGGWGRVSEDGPGHYNPDRSEGPWGRAAMAARMAVSDRVTGPDSERGLRFDHGGHERWLQTVRRDGYAGSRLNRTADGQAPSERPALKPYWGKPAVRNFRGDDGDVGIIRSPVRAIALPDRGGTRTIP